MTKRLDGTVALVTGASSGIGEATARALAEHGAAVAIAARREDRLVTLAAEIAQEGGRALVIPCDITDQRQAERLVTRTVRELGRLDTVVNNAGVMLLGPIAGGSLDDWNLMLDVNVRGALYVSHAALPHLLTAAESAPRHVADLVNVSSMSGRQAHAGSALYNLTKFGIGAFSESLRQEVTQRHVRISLIEPGDVATELFSHNTPEIQQAVREVVGNVESLQADDVADAIVYIVTRHRRVAINEILVRPTEQVV